MERPPALLVDFDETAARENVAEALLARFCTADWHALRDRFRRGLLPLRSYQEEAFRAVRASRRDIERFVEEACHLRPGFTDLARYCQERDIPLVIVSNGLDCYVKPLLRRAGLSRLRVVAVQALFTPRGLRYRYPYEAPTCREWGNCKCRVVEEYRAQGRPVFYIGDGRTDFCPASRADRVWARGTLLALCRERGVPCQEFTDFSGVLRALQGAGPAQSSPPAPGPLAPPPGGLIH